MDKDFSVEFPEMANLPSLLISESNTESKSNDQFQIEINDLRKKYSALLVKHNSLLEANIVLREENIQLKEEIAGLKLK